MQCEDLLLGDQLLHCIQLPLEVSVCVGLWSSWLSRIKVHFFAVRPATQHFKPASLWSCSWRTQACSPNSSVLLSDNHFTWFSGHSRKHLFALRKLQLGNEKLLLLPFSPWIVSWFSPNCFSPFSYLCPIIPATDELLSLLHFIYSSVSPQSLHPSLASVSVFTLFKRVTAA